MPSASQVLAATKPADAAPAVVPPAPAAPAAPTKAGAALPSDADAAAVRREVEIQRKADAVKADAAKLAADKAAFEAARAEDAAVKEARATLAKGDPLAALKLLGVSYDDLTAAQLKLIEGGKPADIAAVRAEVKAQFEAEKATVAETARKEQEAADAAAIKAHELSAVKFVEDNAAAYRLTRKFNAGSLVHQIVIQDLNDRATKDEAGRVVQYPTPISVKEAADRLEKFYRDNVDAIRKEEEAEVAAKKAPVVPATTTPPPAPSATISSDLGGSTGNTPRTFRDDEERMQAAIAQLNASRK